MKKKYEIDEQEHAEFIFLRSMRESLDKHNKLREVTTLICDNCNCPWDIHKEVSDRECASMYCIQCKKICVEDVCDIKVI